MNFRQERSFRWLDELVYAGKPDLSANGWEPLKVTYGDMWEGVGGKTQATVINEAFLRDTYIPTIPSTTKLVCLNVEHYKWRKTDDATVEDSLTKLRHILDIWHSERPDIEIGYYAMGTGRDYWRALGFHGQEGIDAWKADNDRARCVTDAQDVLFPSLYTFYDNEQGILDYMQSNMEEVHRAAPQKKMYPFLWPQYHNSNATLGYQQIPGAYWKKIVSKVYDFGAEGVVFWGAGSEFTWEDREKFEKHLHSRSFTLRFTVRSYLVPANCRLPTVPPNTVI